MRSLSKFVRPGHAPLNLALLLSAAGCATPAPPYAPPATRPVAVAAPNVEVYAYPQAGQTPERQRRDRYECYNWSVEQTGFDPGRLPANSTAPMVRVQPDPPAGHDTAVLAATGAIIGAAVSNPHNAGAGAAVGAVVGAITGAASDSARQDEARRIEDSENARISSNQERINRRAEEYRRAFAACMEARGYAIR